MKHDGLEPNIAFFSSDLEFLRPDHPSQPALSVVEHADFDHLDLSEVEVARRVDHCIDPDDDAYQLEQMFGPPIQPAEACTDLGADARTGRIGLERQAYVDGWRWGAVCGFVVGLALVAAALLVTWS